MSVKDKRIKNVIESDDENELGACGTTNDIRRRPSLAVPEPISGTGSLLEESVDNLSMEVHLGGDNSRHPSEISSVSYQNLLDDGEPTNSIISRRGSDDSLDSYQPDFPDAELPSDYMETFEACDLPLSEHFPMGALQGPENKEKSRGDRSSYLSDSSSNLSRPNVKLKEVSQELGENLVKLREKSTVEKIDDPEEGVTKRNSLEIRNNIPVVGEVKDYEKELNIDFSKVQGTKPKMIGLKQSPGLARRVDIEGQEEREHFDKAPEKQTESSLPPSSTLLTQKVRSKSMDNKTRENVIEVITPIPKNLNIENEYDYVKYARVQQGNSYVGMRLAYSSSNDSLNIKHSAGSDTSSREPSPEKSLHKKIHAEHESQEKVSEETLTEIPLNNSDYSEDKKAFTLSPENTECDSVEVESVTSEGDNSTPGFPTVEDGLSSSQASDAEEGACGHGSNSSPSKILKSKQKSAVQYDLPKEEEDCHPKEMDAQAIMDDLKMKREALDMAIAAIADIKSAIQRSKSMSLESPYPSQQETEESQPVWIKRENKEAQNQLLRRQEEMRRVREEIERQQEQIPTAQGKPFQEKGYDSDDECEDADGIRYTRRNKGKKYAPLQKDDSLEMGGAYGGSKREAALANNQVAHSGSNGSVANHVQGTQLLQEPGEHHVHRTEAPLSSEESSDIDANINSYSRPPNADSDTDEETDRLLQKQYQERDKHVEIPELSEPSATMRSEAERRHSKAKEAAIRDPDRPEVLIEGVLFRARYLGSTQLISEGQPSKAMRMMQAQEAVGRIKASQNQGNSDDKTLGVLHFGERFQAPEGEHQPSTDVDLFVSTEKIMVLNTDLQEIMMDHSLRTISYIADIGDILVIMARRRLITSPDDVLGRRRRQAKILCHVFESDEAQLIAQSIGQAFQVAYLEFLKANGIEDPGLLKEMDYQDVLNQQEIYGEELNLFANKDFHKEVIVPKSKNEPLGVVIVESGWGSMVPTVVLANMLPTGPAARCGQLNIGDQIISINGISLVGLPLSACQTYIKASRTQTVVKLTVVPCPPVVEVLIKRPDVKYQLGFSVQNGVTCSLLRGGIAERGGVRVGHRIIEINNQSVVAVPHEKIVTLLASSVGEIHMKTMPTSIFRLLTGQDVPHYL
uniref:Munc18-1-interacting protein 1 n=1 Tax=Lymnaea stagnalis TaxID=6523 RepID=Q869G0_LYMST|nr:munc18-1-interacting protein 1 [Lymnaea stagnalis]